MHYKTFSGNSYSGGSITRRGERIVYCKITTDIHTSHTLHQETIEHIYTEALLSGSGTLSREAFLDAVNILGASIDVHIANSVLTITIRTLKENLPKVLKLFETMLLKPTFDTKEIKRIQAQKKNELIEARENARAIALAQFVNTIYIKSDRRYTESFDTISEKITTISKNHIQQLHRKILNGFWYVSIGADNTSVEQIITTVGLCKKDSQNSTPTKQEHGQKPQKASLVLKNIPSKQNIEFSIGSALPLTLHHPDYLPFVFGLNVLGKWSGFTGRLMSTVREKEGLTYTIYARTETTGGAEQGYWRIMTFFSPQQSMQGLQSTIREITKIHTKGITKSEFERFKNILTTQQILMTDSLSKSIDELHGYICADYDIHEMNTFKQQLLTVTQKEINQALKKYLNPDTLIISGAGPISEVRQQIQKSTFIKRTGK